MTPPSGADRVKELEAGQEISYDAAMKVLEMMKP